MFTCLLLTDTRYVICAPLLLFLPPINQEQPLLADAMRVVNALHDSAARICTPAGALQPRQ